MSQKSSTKAAAKLREPADLQKAVEKISFQMKGDAIATVQLLGERLKDADSFRDSFTDGGHWRDTFVDGGQFLSNFNNLGQLGSVQHEAVQFALEKFQQAAKATGE